MFTFMFSEKLNGNSRYKSRFRLTSEKVCNFHHLYERIHDANTLDVTMKTHIS